jgi:hypothetical protein
VSRSLRFLIGSLVAVVFLLVLFLAYHASGAAGTLVALAALAFGVVAIGIGLSVRSVVIGTPTVAVALVMLSLHNASF